MSATYPSVGQLVRCVKGDWGVAQFILSPSAGALPRLNHIYSIRKIASCLAPPWAPYIYLNEVSVVSSRGVECAFSAQFFVPLDDLDDSEKLIERQPPEVPRGYDFPGQRVPKREPGRVG